MCKFNWFLLPQDIKKAFSEKIITVLGEEEGQKIIDNINWFNLPTKLNDLADKLSIPLQKPFTWFRLPEDLVNFCEQLQ